MDFNNNLIIQFATYIPVDDDYKCVYPLSCNVFAVFLHGAYSASKQQWIAMVNKVNGITTTHFQVVCKNVDKVNSYGRYMYALIIGSVT